MISLEKQLPRPRMLTGIGTPALVVSVLLVLLAVFAFAYLSQGDANGVPKAVVDSQREFVHEISRGLNNSVARSRDELSRTVEAYDKRPDHAAAQLAALTQDQPKWRSAAIFAPGGQTASAAVGQPVPLPPGTLPTRAALPLVDGNAPRLLLVEPLADGKLLIAELDLNVRSLRLEPRAKQAILIVVPDGGRALAQGAPVQDQPELDALIRQAVDGTARQATASRVGPAAPPADRSSNTAVAPLITADAVGKLGFAIVSLVYTDVVDSAVTWEPMIAALALLVAAVAVLLILHHGLSRPVRRLLAYAKAVASGNSPGTPPRTPNAQVNRIVEALSALASGQRPRAAVRDRSSGGVPAGGAVVLAVVAVLGAAGGVMATLIPAERDLPSQVIRDSENQVGAVADAVGDTLDGGYRKLVLLGGENGRADTDQMRGALARLLDENNRFRSAYVLSANGSVVTRAGRKPLRPEIAAPGEGGVVLHDVQGRIPIVYAYHPLSDGRSLVAEFDVRYLSRLLERMNGRLRVLDVDRRDILDTGGYLAFDQITTPVVETAHAQALTGRAYAEVTDVDGARSLLLAAPVALDGSAAQLEWTVVAERPVTGFALPGNQMHHGALLVAVVAVGVGLLLFGWLYFFQLRPLRNLAREATVLMGGDTSRVVSPRWHDEVGAVAVCLEVCRQAALHGEQRLGGAARLRGTEGIPTTIMNKVPERRHGGQTRRRGD
ncbi:hypothetical protein [Micromonospora sp. WMMD980]|uniref:cache domain-containing protein n=1 Tax=Micromonospora sp. WMMD980 TaxID=3016088 RepID=UPI0024171CBA|nr:hypothetical protein [Micromonospora sp. WMMD980]MDG4803414.1 hypothetical protein [Micromonospora sp. WMMD980]